VKKGKGGRIPSAPVDKLRFRVWFAEIQDALNVQSPPEVALKLGFVKKIKAVKDTPEDSEIRKWNYWGAGTKKPSAAMMKQIERKVEKIAGTEARARCQHAFIYGPSGSQLWASINFHDDPSTRPATKINGDNIITNYPKKLHAPKKLLNLADATTCYFIALESFLACLGIRDNMLTYQDDGFSSSEGCSELLQSLREENSTRYMAAISNLLKAAQESVEELSKKNIPIDFFISKIEEQARWLIRKHLPRYELFCDPNSICLVNLNLRQFCSTKGQKSLSEQKTNISDKNRLSCEDINDMFDAATS